MDPLVESPERCSALWWLEQLNRVTRGILDHGLASAAALDDPGPDTDAGIGEPGQHSIQLGNHYLKPVPPARSWEPARVVWLPGAAGAWPVEQQPEMLALEHGETGRRVHLDLEVQVFGVERDGVVDVVDDVADTWHR